MDQTRLLDRLRSQCSRREYCEADIRRKISAEEAKCGFPLGADAIIASLKEDNYLSDARFAEAFARDKSSLDGWGSLKIRCALQARGLAKADIDAGLAAIDEASASGRLEKLVLAKHRLLADDPQCRLKLLKYALGRGYSYDEAEAAVRLAMGKDK